MAHLVLTVDEIDHVFQLKGLIRIGRHPDNDVQVLDARVSKRHCEVQEHEGGWILRDLGTLNGTFINGERIKGEKRLAHRDVIRVGSSSLTFSDLGEALEQAPPPAAFRRRADVSGLARTALGHAAPAPSRAEREQSFRQHLRSVLAAPSSGELLRALLDGALALAEADAGVVLGRIDGAPIATPAELQILQWSGRGRELPERPESQSTLLEALQNRATIVKPTPRDSTYRIWEARCASVVVIAHANQLRGILWIEGEGEEAKSIEEVELLATAAGAALAAL